MFKVIKFIVLIAIITICQAEIPFNIDLKTRIINNSRTLINIQITNLIDKPLDYMEGFIKEVNSANELINEKRIVILYGYEPPLQTGFSTTKSLSFPYTDNKNQNNYEFYISKLRFIGESRVFTWHPKIGFLRID